jgi:hypothetical protein
VKQTPVVSNFALDCAVRNFHENEEGFELNGTRQLLDFVSKCNLLFEDINTLNTIQQNLSVGTSNKGWVFEGV